MQVTHMVQQRWESRPQLQAQQPHWGLGSQQEPPQSAQSRAHQPGVTLAQCTQERGQQRTHMPHLRGAERPARWAPLRVARTHPTCPLPHLTLRRLSARCPRPSRPSQRTVGSGSSCQLRSRSRTASSRNSRVVGLLCNSYGCRAYGVSVAWGHIASCHPLGEVGSPP